MSKICNFELLSLANITSCLTVANSLLPGAVYICNLDTPIQRWALDTLNKLFSSIKHLLIIITAPRAVNFWVINFLSYSLNFGVLVVKHVSPGSLAKFF